VRFHELILEAAPNHPIMQALAIVRNRFQESFDPFKEGIRVGK